MTEYIVFVAMLIAILVLWKRDLETAFLQVWIPFFMLLPFIFWIHVPLLSDYNFMSAAIFPILFVLLKNKFAEIRIGTMESMLLIYVIIRVVADYFGRGYSDAQHYAHYMAGSVIGPYLLGRHIINSRRMDIETARMFVLMLLLLFPAFLFEAKFWVSPIYKLLSPFFPHSYSSISLRWGIARTAGTFEHPILACIMIVVVYRLHRWLSWLGVWEQAQAGGLGWIQKQARRFSIPFKHQISIVFIVMALMTISRGPWIGAFIGAALAAVGTTKNRQRWLVIFIVVFLLGGLAGQLALDAYITPKDGEILSGEAQTMLYRKVMIEQYKGFLMEKFWTGWGLTTVPKIRGMESVDNAFFLMALQHGVLAPAMFVIMFVYAIISQVKFGIKAARDVVPIGFTFSGIYLMCFIAFATVYMGAQTEPMLFLLLGWGESIKNRKESDRSISGDLVEQARPAPPFRRVMY
jgi:hypothetical protein